jgi:hypothetical protein
MTIDAGFAPEVWEYAAQQFEPGPDYVQDPVAWGEDILGEYYWSKQREIMESVRDNRYTAVQSCHDAGKSFIAARIAAWWLDCHEPGEAFIVTTAPTAAQVYAILWREITKAHTKGELMGRIVSSGYPQWKLPSGELVGYGRKPADYEQSAFQGIHARYVLVVMDEACGIDRNLFDAVDSLATNQDARVLAIGNPDDPASHFAHVCKPKSGWNSIRIDGLRTPNITLEQIRQTYCAECEGRPKLLQALLDEEGIEPNTEDVPELVRPMLLSPLWIEERLHRWVGRPGPGESLVSKTATSALFTAKVRGVFPDTTAAGVIPLGWAQKAVDRWNDWKALGKPPMPGRRVIGVDVAREGEDQTCLYVREGVVPTSIERYSGKDTMETTGLVRAKLNYPQSMAVVDVIGIGAGVVDRLREQRQAVVAFNASHNAGDRTDHTGSFHFNNNRSAAWWNLREMLDPSQPGGVRLMLPDDEQLLADLTTPRWRLHSGGKLIVESKDEIRKRLGRSPDAGDACVMAHWVDGTPIPGNGEIAGSAVPWYPNETELDTRPVPDPAVSWDIDQEADTW